ncbi:MAG TPA: hypothetical protein VFM13_00375 [Gaiellaceae bacterium]|nr:hypothetical protein [Gaiellaceae bacterium]
MRQVGLRLQDDGVDPGDGGSRFSEPAAETIGGRWLLPDRNVSRVATVPLALPSRSAAIRRGAARPSVSASRRARAFVITMPSSIQRGTGTFKITSVVRIAGPSILRRNVPEPRRSLRERFSVERTRVPSTALAAQRSTWSFGVFAVCPLAT